MTTSGARRSPRNVRTDGDVTRPRGLIVGAMVGVVLLVSGLLALNGPRALATPGPIALPHQALGCGDCHRGENLSTACTSCHGSHDSSRAAHRDLEVEGRLGCGRCHAVHRAELGIRFEPGGQARVFGTGFESVVPSSFGAKLTAPVVVPVVARSACAGCHRLGNPEDPAAHCVSGGGANRLSLCFDEHRRPAARAAAASSERDGAVEAARALAVQAPFLFEHGVLAGHGALLGLALGVGLAASAAGTALGRLTRRKRRLRASATTANGAPRRLPIVDTTRCLGCHACADACPYDVLEIKRYVAVVARPDACCGVGPCEERCPNGSLVLGPSAANPVPPARAAPGLAVEPGLYLAGDVTGGTLIRSALRQGVQVAHQAHDERRCRPPSAGRDVDLLVIGAGPAGLAAALTAQRLGLAVTVLEAGAIGESIRRFSREKLVLDAAEDPREELPLFIADAPKEALLERWLYTVRHARLGVHEGTRVVRLDPPDGDGVRRVHAMRGDEAVVFSGRAVLVAVGRRGTPRRLAAAIDDDVVGRVHYELSDARAFAGKRVVVVGLGDVAMETAIALAAQSGTEVAIVHRGSGFRRGKRRNIDALSRLLARGRVELHLSTEVVSVTRYGVAITGRDRPLSFDALFVAIGSYPESASAAWFAPRPESD